MAAMSDYLEDALTAWVAGTAFPRSLRTGTSLAARGGGGVAAATEAEGGGGSVT